MRGLGSLLLKVGRRKESLVVRSDHSIRCIFVETEVDQWLPGVRVGW